MDHDYIETHGLIDLYHRGQLPPEEEVRFEEHFVGCRECQERLEMARSFQRGLKTVAAQEIVQAGLLAWLARRRGIALAALLLVAGLPVLGYLAGSREPEEAGWRQRYESAQRSAADLRGRLEESERLRREHREQERVARVEPTPKPEAPRPSPSPSPLVNTPVFLLTAVRGEDETATIDPGEKDYFSLAVDAGDDPRFESYRVTITSARGDRVFREAGLKPNALEALLLTFPAGYFQPGEYRLVVEGVTPEGTASELGGYAFRVR